MSTPSEHPRYKARPRAIYLGAGLFAVLFVIAFTYQSFGSFTPKVEPLSATPVQPSLYAALPHGPQNMTVDYTAGPATAPTATLSFTGYIDFPSADPTQCSMQGTGTATLLTPGYPKAATDFTIRQAAGQDTFTLLNSPTGQYTHMTSGGFIPFTFPLVSQPGIPAPFELSRFAGDYCGFDQMSRYASLAASGTIVWSPSKYANVIAHYSDQFYATIISAASGNYKTKNAVYNSVVATSFKASSYTTQLNAWSATLHHSAKQITYSEQLKNAHLTISFVPTTSQDIPALTQPSFIAETIAYAKSSGTIGVAAKTYTP